MDKIEKAQRDLRHLETIYGFWLLDVLFELMLTNKLTEEEAENLMNSL